MTHKLALFLHPLSSLFSCTLLNDISPTLHTMISSYDTYLPRYTQLYPPVPYISLTLHAPASSCLAYLPRHTPLHLHISHISLASRPLSSVSQTSHATYHHALLYNISHTILAPVPFCPTWSILRHPVSDTSYMETLLDLYIKYYSLQYSNELHSTCTFLITPVLHCFDFD